MKLMHEEKLEKERLIRIYGREVAKIKEYLHQTMSYVDFIHICSTFLVHNDKRILECEKVHQYKLYTLIHEHDPQNHDPEKVIFNYSSYTLTEEEKRVLSYGINISLPPRKLNYADHLVPFKLLYRNVKNLNIREGFEDEFKSGLKTRGGG